MKITEEVRYLCNKLEQSGFEAWVVGGCVRDFYMNKTPGDYDITTNATYDEIANCLKDDVMEIEYGTSKEFDVFVCYYNHEKYEIATFRKDKEYYDHRHCVTEVTEKIDDDLSRRDFTINSLAYRPATDELKDLFGGLEDINKRIIRAVGKAEDRINEDALRILRAYRFSANFGFELDNELRDTCQKYFNSIFYCSQERITNEITKLITKHIYNESSAISILTLVNSKVDSKIIDELNSLNKGAVDEILAWAILLQNVDNPKEILGKCKHSRYFIDLVNALIVNKDIDFKSKEDIKRWASKYSIELFKYLNAFQYIMNAEGTLTFNEKRKLVREIVKNDEPHKLYQLDVDGNDLIALGYEGKAIGEKLNRLLELVIDNPQLNCKDILLEGEYERL